MMRVRPRWQGIWRPLSHAIAAWLLVALYLITPYAASGFEGGGCGCEFGEYTCGLDGYRCFCCHEFAQEAFAPGAETGAMISMCRLGARFWSVVDMPPATTEPLWPAMSPLPMAGRVHYEKMDISDIYTVLPERPPRPAIPC